MGRLASQGGHSGRGVATGDQGRSGRGEPFERRVCPAGLEERKEWMEPMTVEWEAREVLQGPPSEQKWQGRSLSGRVARAERALEEDI